LEVFDLGLFCIYAVSLHREYKCLNWIQRFSVVLHRPYAVLGVGCYLKFLCLYQLGVLSNCIIKASNQEKHMAFDSPVNSYNGTKIQFDCLFLLEPKT